MSSEMLQHWLLALAREMGERLKKRISRRVGDRVGFAFFVFEYGENGALAYVASADRAGVMGALREWLARQDAEREAGELK